MHSELVHIWLSILLLIWFLRFLWHWQRWRTYGPTQSLSQLATSNGTTHDYPVVLVSSQSDRTLRPVYHLLAVQTHVWLTVSAAEVVYRDNRSMAAIPLRHLTAVRATVRRAGGDLLLALVLLLWSLPLLWTLWQTPSLLLGLTISLSAFTILYLARNGLTRRLEMEFYSGPKFIISFSTAEQPLGPKLWPQLALDLVRVIRKVWVEPSELLSMPPSQDPPTTAPSRSSPSTSASAGTPALHPSVPPKPESGADNQGVPISRITIPGNYNEHPLDTRWLPKFENSQIPLPPFLNPTGDVKPREREQWASELLEKAGRAFNQQQPQTAKQLWLQIIEEYPETQAAEKARRNLFFTQDPSNPTPGNPPRDPA